MLKEAIEKILDIAKPEVTEIDGNNFIIRPEGAVQIHEDIDLPAELNLNSLDALVKMLRVEAAAISDVAAIGEGGPIFVSVASHENVIAFMSPGPDTRWQRPYLYRAKATDVPGWESQVQLGFEQAIVALQTRFQKSLDFEYAMQILSQITTGGKMTFNDNGIATTIVTQKGVSLASNMAIKPIVTLRPYRTFHEVDQPEGLFLIRISERGITFTEADGGMWKLTARKTIKAFLEEQLKPEVDSSKIVVMM